MYAPLRLETIIEERYFITKNTATSYTDTGTITPKERKYLIKFILRDIERKRKDLQSIMKK